MKTDNELIEEFMGKPDYIMPELLKYHKSWDWLMPVVEKINALEMPDNFDFDILISLHEWICQVFIKNAYADVVTIIKWYNQNKAQ